MADEHNRLDSKFSVVGAFWAPETTDAVQTGTLTADKNGITFTTAPEYNRGGKGMPPLSTLSEGRLNSNIQKRLRRLAQPLWHHLKTMQHGSNSWGVLAHMLPHIRRIPCCTKIATVDIPCRKNFVIKKSFNSRVLAAAKAAGAISSGPGKTEWAGFLPPCPRD